MAEGKFLFLAIASELVFFAIWADDVTPWEWGDLLDFTHIHHEWVQLLLLPITVGAWYFWWRANKRATA